MIREIHNGKKPLYLRNTRTFYLWLLNITIIISQIVSVCNMQNGGQNNVRTKESEAENY
jgi:hypothetical protein